MNSILIFIVVLGILIFFHELGHFLVARLFGVGVEKFSLGFGPRIFGRTIGRTDYRISLIPLGGYVKMVGDEPDAPIEPEDLPYSFTHKHVAKRSLIVAAGPMFNVLLAILIFTTVMLFVGLPSIRPFVRSMQNDSPAQQAGMVTGDRVVAIDRKEVRSWRDIDAALDDNQGKPLRLTIQREGDLIDIDVKPVKISVKNLFGDTTTYFDIGISGIAELRAIVDMVMEGMPAHKAGLRKGDQIIAIDGRSIDRWESMQEIVSQSDGRTLLFKVRRDDDVFETPITPDLIQEKNLLGVKQNAYRIGIRAPSMPVPDEDQITVKLNPIQALGQGIGHTWNMTKLTVYFFGKMFQGKVPMESIGGPIRIAQMARKEADQGLVRLLNFIAIISVNLAILNLLPIPVLDGGHLLFYAIEAVLRRPVSARMRETAQQIGIFLLLLLMIFVFYNDITLTWFK
jgi:regulator of sigma E protease